MGEIPDQTLQQACGLAPVMPAQESLRWVAQLRDGTVIHQYDALGAQAKFALLPPGQVAVIWLHALLPIEGAAVQFVDVLAAILHVPPGAQPELIYRGGLDLKMSGGVITGQQAAPRQLLCGWRFHDGSRRECWVLVQPDGTAHVGLDPQRPWRV